MHENLFSETSGHFRASFLDNKFIIILLSTKFNVHEPFADKITVCELVSIFDVISILV